MYSALIRPPEGVDIPTLVSRNMRRLVLPPGHPSRPTEVLPFGRDTGVVLVIAPDEHVAAAELREALGPSGEILSGPAPVQAVLPVSG